MPSVCGGVRRFAPWGRAQLAEKAPEPPCTPVHPYNSEYCIPEEHRIGHKDGEDESRVNLAYGYMWGRISDRS